MRTFRTSLRLDSEHRNESAVNTKLAKVLDYARRQGFHVSEAWIQAEGGKRSEVKGS